MKLQGARELYYFYTGKTSDIVRQLALGAIAIIWLFKTSVGEVTTVHAGLALPLKLIVLGLTFDLLQYAVAALLWGGYQRIMELRGTPECVDFKAPRQLNWLTVAFFLAKVGCVVAAYWFLLLHLSSRIQLAA